MGLKGQPPDQYQHQPRYSVEKLSLWPHLPLLGRELWGAQTSGF